MRSIGAIDGDVATAVDNYFRQCSVAVTCRDLAVMAATLANGGRNPVTGDIALRDPYVESVMSVMSTCGMYDASGEWMFSIGLPAKSGVSGGVIAILPGQFGISVFSPRLDGRGNSTRGIAVCERIAADFGLHPARFRPDIGAVIRRSYTCAHARSSRQRPAAETSVLDAYGHTARVFELQGELFAGTAERVVRRVVESFDDATIVVLDCMRVSRIDDAARRLIDETVAGVAGGPHALLLAGIEGHSGVDSALEWCEDEVLARHSPGATDAAHDLTAQDLFAGLQPEDVEALVGATRTHTLGAGDVLFKQGDPADAVFFIVSGALAVTLRADDDAPVRRLARLGPGVAVGEMALLADSVRSADVVAVDDSTLVELRIDHLATLARSRPGIESRVQINLARVLADRLRRANEHLALLAS
jgi:glutaminase